MLDLLNSTVPIHGRKIVREERQGRRKREKVGKSGEVAKSSRSQGACHACQLKPPAWASCCFLDPTDPAQSSPDREQTASRILEHMGSSTSNRQSIRVSQRHLCLPTPGSRVHGTPSASPNPSTARPKEQFPPGPPWPGPGSRLYHRPGSPPCPIEDWKCPHVVGAQEIGCEWINCLR